MAFHSNGTGNIRQNNTIYRGPSTSAVPWDGSSHVSMQPMFQHPIHQYFKVPSYPTPRQPAYQNPQYPYLQAIQPSYQFNSPMEQPQKGPVGANLGLSVGNAISVQPSLNGPPGASQSQMFLPPVTVLGVTSTDPDQQQVGVSTPSLVGKGMPISRTVIKETSEKKVSRRKYAFDIIHPVTKCSIFKDDFFGSQTPAVSATSDASSEKIRPTIQKRQTKKKIPIHPPKDKTKNTSSLEKKEGSNNNSTVVTTPLNNNNINNSIGKSENNEADELDDIQVELSKMLSVPSTHDVFCNFDEDDSEAACCNNQDKKLSPSGAGTEAVSSDRRQQLNELSKINTAASPAAETITVSSLISYEEGQWSPLNPTGKKQYNIKQLILLREAQASRLQPVHIDDIRD